MGHKPLVEDALSLHIRDVREKIPAKAVAATLDLFCGVHVQEQPIVGRLTNLRNGYRHFFICTRCHRTFEILYCTLSGAWTCRNCAGLVYASSLR